MNSHKNVQNDTTLLVIYGENFHEDLTCVRQISLLTLLD